MMKTLVETMRKRLRIDEPLQFEKFFAKYYPDMDRLERFELKQLRAVTEGMLHDANAAALAVLEESPALVALLPDLEKLRTHLVFWLNKFDQVFRTAEEMCCGLRRRRRQCPVSTGIEDQIRAHLEGRS